jgi:ribosome maturation factor RimP
VAPLFFFAAADGTATMDRIRSEIEQRVEELGYEAVEIERAGSAGRPIIRLKIDRPDGPPEGAVGVDDCARVSRALEGWLDEEAALSPRYQLEVSSPGVERPLLRGRDWERFAGRDAIVEGDFGEAGTRLEGTLRGLADEGTGILETAVGRQEVDLERVKKAKLVFRWGGSAPRGKR